jgi:hypothetical protein
LTPEILLVVMCLSRVWGVIVAVVHFVIEFGDLITALTAIAGATWAVIHFQTVLLPFIGR